MSGGRTVRAARAPVVALVAAWSLALLLAPASGSAKIAVFTDGRILKVEDAYLDGDRIVLELAEGGRLVVAAIRIDRVVADEVEDHPRPVAPVACPAGWADEPLPDWVPFRASIHAAARAANVHPWLLAALVQAESAFDPRAVSRAGATGLTQLMPAAAADHGIEDVFDPDENLRGGAGHLRLMLDRFATLPLALAAYNAGAATVERYEGVPPYRETRDYVRRILAAFCPGTDDAPHPTTQDLGSGG
ncbi:MAG TPA: lytic transglycosylase domain-containing protein [Thermoanaerobaculales bacterium]|nr:lytic transglycosylase domain-containing protein [Thermoanaerobaculales bacterium]HQN97292.1 lytic transglycosylase domain-containing protein [Thermoanaerobaculales bacterium]HQP44781.1 lytic transglycosylase domain-containing protein [Thermoanaerobaculales bacterium]